MLAFDVFNIIAIAANAVAIDCALFGRWIVGPYDWLVSWLAAGFIVGQVDGNDGGIIIFLFDGGH